MKPGKDAFGRWGKREKRGATIFSRRHDKRTGGQAARDYVASKRVMVMVMVMVNNGDNGDNTAPLVTNQRKRASGFQW